MLWCPHFPIHTPPASRPQLPLLSCYHAPPPSSCDLSLNPSSCCCRRRTPDTRLPLFRPSLSPSVFVSSIAMSRSPMRRWTDADDASCVAAQSTTPKRATAVATTALPFTHFIFVSRFMFPFCYVVVRPSVRVGAPRTAVSSFSDWDWGWPSASAGRGPPVAAAATTAYFPKVTSPR